MFAEHTLFAILFLHIVAVPRPSCGRPRYGPSSYSPSIHTHAEDSFYRVRRPSGTAQSFLSSGLRGGGQHVSCDPSLRDVPCWDPQYPRLRGFSPSRCPSRIRGPAGPRHPCKEDRSSAPTIRRSGAFWRMPPGPPGGPCPFFSALYTYA